MPSDSRAAALGTRGEVAEPLREPLAGRRFAEEVGGWKLHAHLAALGLVPGAGSARRTGEGPVEGPHCTDGQYTRARTARQRFLPGQLADDHEPAHLVAPGPLHA